jgi:hypothetical protein
MSRQSPAALQVRRRNGERVRRPQPERPARSHGGRKGRASAIAAQREAIAPLAWYGRSPDRDWETIIEACATVLALGSLIVFSSSSCGRPPVTHGDHFTVWFDGTKVLDAKDGTFKDAGRIGLWTKADSVIAFDDLTIEGH